MDIDVAKIGNTVPKMDDVKKELFNSTNKLLARGLKISFQWYVFNDIPIFKNYSLCVYSSLSFVRSSDLLLSLEVGNSPKPLPKKIEGYKRPKFNHKDLLKRSSVVKPVDIYSIDNISIPYNEMEQYIHARSCYSIKEYQRYLVIIFRFP